MDLSTLTPYLGPALKGAIGGFVVAARVDIKTFREAQARGDADEFLKDFDWTVARRRWISGLIFGALSGLVLG